MKQVETAHAWNRDVPCDRVDPRMQRLSPLVRRERLGVSREEGDADAGGEAEGDGGE